MYILATWLYFCVKCLVWWNVLFLSEQASITLVKHDSCVKRYQQTICRVRSHKLTINH